MNNCLSTCLAVNKDSLPGRRLYQPPKTLFFLLIFFLPFLGKAQGDQMVTGTITDSASRPLSGVTVSTDASKRNVITNDEGFFSIRVSPKDKNLSFNYVGMESLTQAINGSSELRHHFAPRRIRA